MKFITRLAFVLSALVVLALPAVVSAQTSVNLGQNGVSYSSPGFSFSFGSTAGCGGGNICQVASTILFIINSVLVPVLFAVAFIVFLYGIARAYIFSNGEPAEISKGHQLILWGIIGFVVMVSLWGLVNVVANTFGLSGSVAPMLPTSQGSAGSGSLNVSI